jgi:hypothetical protein
VTTVLVIGGAGVFGGHLARELAAMGLSVTVAGRDLERAEAAADSIGGAAVRLDRDRVTAAELRASGAAVVVDAAGPFQGVEPTVARAATEAGLHYVDLADARDFVAGFAALDAQARAAGVTLLTGASSTPALSHVVLDHLTEGWRRIDHVEAAISPGARAPRGRAVMEAILTWLGRPVRVFSDGRWRERRGWGGLYRREMGAAGRRWLSLCETPDLDLMAARFRPTQSALFLAGLEPPALHLGAWLLGGLSALTGIRLKTAAPALAMMAKPFALIGDDRGAMRVEARGLDADGRPVRAVWSLTAAPGKGPVTPALPAAAAVAAIIDGETEPGARAFVGLLSLKDMAPLLARHGLETATGVTPLALFERAVGAGFDSLPEPIKALHRTTGRSIWRGRASTQGAQTLVARLTAAVIGFPGAQQDAPVEVDIEAGPNRSVWRRTIGRDRFRSVLSARPGGVSERFGALTFDLRLTPAPDRLVYEVAGWRLGPLPLPRWLAPVTHTYEAVDDRGRFTFDVEVRAPLIGRLVRYRGWLVRVD